MEVFLTIAGLIIGISVFLYLLSAVDSGKRIIAKANTDQPVKKESQTEPVMKWRSAQTTAPKARSNHYVYPSESLTQSLPEELKNCLPTRSCPMCGETLTRDDALYASRQEFMGEKKLLIHGCAYCYKGERRKNEDASSQPTIAH